MTYLREGRVATVTRKGIPYLIVLSCMAVATRLAALPLTNPDTYFHLRFGHEFITSWSLRAPGSVSSFATQEWLPTQWLSQVVMARIEEAFGLAGVAWLSGLLFVALVLGLYCAARTQAGPLPSAAVTSVAFIASWPALSMRPQVISYLLCAVIAALWYQAQARQSVPWLVVPLTWLWAMCHGMWPIALIISAAAVLGIRLDRTTSRNYVLRCSAVVALSALAAAATPVGPALYGAVLQVGSRTRYFSEWGPPSFTSLHSLALLGLVAAPIVALIRRKATCWFDTAFAGLALLCAIYSMRTGPLAAAIAAPVLAGLMQEVLGERNPWTRLERAVVFGAAVSNLAVLSMIVPRVAGDVPPEPSWVGGSLASLPPGTPLLNEWPHGGYLMWRYPNLDLVMHGYGDTFTLEELERNVDIRSLQPGWDVLVRKTGATQALLDPSSPLAYALTGMGWSIQRETADLALLRAPDDWLVKKE